MKREVKKRLTYECRCDERLKTKDERYVSHTLCCVEDWNTERSCNCLL
jgi:hypothetical protein